MKKESVKTIIALLFVVTGIAGLIYQIVWFKYLSLFLGNTTYAQMIVLAAFLGGLAFGNHMFGKKSDSLKNHVLVYSLLEIFVGIYCLLYPTLNDLVGNLFLSLSSENDLITKPFLFTGIRFFIAAILLFLPTTAMGGTLPILSSYFVEKLDNTRKDVAVLYFLNSFGAVIGIIFAGFILIKEFGLETTIYVTAFLNISAGITALYLSRNKATPEILCVEPSEETNSGTLSIDKPTAVLVVLVAGISGMAALLYEMVWVRLLINFFGSSTYAFSIMLLSFISGITIGSFLISHKIKFNQINLLVFLQAAIAFSTMIVLLFYERLPYYLWKVAALFSRTPESFDLFLAVEFLICFCLMFFQTIFMGMTLPVATDIISAANKKVGFSVGKIFSINTLGTVFGVILTGLFFIPLFGIKITFEIGIALNLFAAIILLLRSKFYFSFQRVFIAAFFIVSFVLYHFLFPRWNEKIMLSGVFRSLSQEPPKTFAEFSSSLTNHKILFYKEGIGSTVAVTQSLSNPAYKRLIINGKPDASTYHDMPTQVLVGEIPLLLHPNPKNVFVVGFGSGTTIGSVLKHPVDNVTCAEISKEVINAASLFSDVNYNCVEDPRLKIYNEDAVTLLKLSKEKYDVIISEPSNPWIAGIGNLFSKEYFSKCLSKLSSNGIMVQWFHLYEAGDDVVQLVLNTFSSVFPYSQVWNGVANDIILVGSKNEIELDFNLLNKKFNNENVKKDFERIGIDNIYSFLFCQSVSPRGFYAMALPSPLNSETHPLLEFWAPHSFFIGRHSNFIYYADEKFDTIFNKLYVRDYIKQQPPTKQNLVNAIDYALTSSKNYRFAYGLSKFLKESNPNDYQINLFYSKALEKLEIHNPRKTSLELLSSLFPDSLQIKKDLSNITLKEKLNSSTFLNIFSIEKEAKTFIETTRRDSASLVSVYIQLASAFLKNSELNNAEKMLLEAEKFLIKSPNLIKSIAAEEYFYTGAIIYLYKKEYEKVFGYYFALGNYNFQYDKLPKLRNLVAWYLKQDK